MSFFGKMKTRRIEDYSLLCEIFCTFINPTDPWGCNMWAPLPMNVDILLSHGSVELMNVCPIVNTSAYISIPRIRGIDECLSYCMTMCILFNPTDPWN
jgi:hypothetical protein